MPKKLTKEEFISREEDILSGEYLIVGAYKNTHTKVLIKHNKCGYEWMIKPASFHSGRRCPKCAGNIKLTKEEFCQREEDIVSGEYKMIGVYVNTYTKTLFRHNLCGYEWKAKPHNFHQGKRCPKCANQKKGLLKRLTKEEFINREPDLLNGEYEFVGEYITAGTKTLFKHNTCEYEWMIKPSDFHIGKRCPKCAIRKQTLTKEVFIEREDDIQSGEYLMIGRYVNRYTKTLFRHNTCGYEWKALPQNFHAGKKCPKCAGNIKLTKEEFCEREKDVVSGEYEIIGEYINANTKTLFKHNLCGCEWKITPGHFYQGNRCPKCNQSKGEKRIYNILNLLNIPFEAQKRFNTCKYKRTLPFDFYVSNSFLIEYDGEQHFRPVDYFGGDKVYKTSQLRDNIKTKWAKDNGIPLVRIPYTEFDNIEQIIKDNIEKYSIQKVG
jgi:Zn ribbon nucleic-acid-binding protein|nr:MAG TPA: restriction enzyme [Caudoviricetes sp.]